MITPLFQPGAPPTRPKGVVLVITLFILVLVTLVTLSSIRGTLMEEKMASNLRDRNRALQAAEAALRQCLNQISIDPLFYPQQAPAAANSPPLWDVAASWASNSNTTTEINLGTTTLAENPRCLVENINTIPGAISLRITSRAVGGAPDSVVILQATYSNE